MEAFINPTLLAEQKARSRRSTLVFRLFAAAMLLAFVTMCLLTRTANARAMFIAMLASMIPAGMICILLYCLRVRPDRMAARHTKMLLDGAAETDEGEFRYAGGPVQIPGSVRVLPVSLQNGEESRCLFLDETLAGRMPAEGTRVRVQTVRRYITGAEILSGNENTAEQNARPERKRHPLLRQAFSMFPVFVLWAMAVGLAALYYGARVYGYELFRSFLNSPLLLLMNLLPGLLLLPSLLPLQRPYLKFLPLPGPLPQASLQVSLLQVVLLLPLPLLPLRHPSLLVPALLQVYQRGLQPGLPLLLPLQPSLRP